MLLFSIYSFWVPNELLEHDRYNHNNNNNDNSARVNMIATLNLVLLLISLPIAPGAMR